VLQYVAVFKCCSMLHFKAYSGYLTVSLMPAQPLPFLLYPLSHSLSYRHTDNKNRHIQTHAHTHMHTRTHTHTHTHTHTNACARAHARAHTHTHTHTHTLDRSRGRDGIGLAVVHVVRCSGARCMVQWCTCCMVQWCTLYGAVVRVAVVHVVSHDTRCHQSSAFLCVFLSLRLCVRKYVPA